jgi:hypothetical protein
MGNTTLQLPFPDPSNVQKDQPANHAGSVIAFPSMDQSSRPRLLRSLVAGKQGNQKPARKAKELLSKYIKSSWSFTVGAKVAAVSDGEIVQGTILGTKAKPWRPAAFWRKGFAGCWILLDSGERVVAYELRPIHEIQRRS